MSVISGNLSAIDCNSVSVRFEIVNPCIEVKSLTEEYLKFVSLDTNFDVNSDAGSPEDSWRLFMGVINILLVNASQPG